MVAMTGVGGGGGAFGKPHCNCPLGWGVTCQFWLATSHPLTESSDICAWLRVTGVSSVSVGTCALAQNRVRQRVTWLRGRRRAVFTDCPWRDCKPHAKAPNLKTRVSRPSRSTPRDPHATPATPGGAGRPCSGLVAVPIADASSRAESALRLPHGAWRHGRHRSPPDIPDTRSRAGPYPSA